MATYRSYESAYQRGGRDVWPGCGPIGRCMPCNRIHNFDYQSYAGGPVTDDYRCARNDRAGCPQPKPKPKHDFHLHGRCRRCGTWAAPLQYETVGGLPVRRDGVLSWRCLECGASGVSKTTRRTCPECCRSAKEKT